MKSNTMRRRKSVPGAFHFFIAIPDMNQIYRKLVEGKNRVDQPHYTFDAMLVLARIRVMNSLKIASSSSKRISMAA